MNISLYAEYKRNRTFLFVSLLAVVAILIFSAIVGWTTTGFGARYVVFVTFGGISIGAFCCTFLLHVGRGIAAVATLHNSRNDYLRALPLSPSKRLGSLLLYYMGTTVVYIIVMTVVCMVYATAVSQHNIFAGLQFDNITFGWDGVCILLAVVAFFFTLYGAGWGISAFAAQYVPKFNRMVALIAGEFIMIFAYSSLIYLLYGDSAIINSNGADLGKTILLAMFGLLGMYTALTFFDAFKQIDGGKMKRYGLGMVVIVAVCGVLFGCARFGSFMYGNITYGEVTTIEESYGEVTALRYDARYSSVRGSITSPRLTLVPGGSGVTFTLNDGLREAFDINYSSGELTITQTRVLPANVRCEIRIGVGALTNLNIEGVVSVDCDGQIVGDTLDFTNMGVSRVSVDFAMKDVVIYHEGVGTLLVNGSADNLNFSMQGVGSADLRNFKCKNVIVDAEGVGTTTVWATDTLDITLAGIGSVQYYGSPSITQRRDGLGAIKSMGDK